MSVTNQQQSPTRSRSPSPEPKTQDSSQQSVNHGKKEGHGSSAAQAQLNYESPVAEIPQKPREISLSVQDNSSKMLLSVLQQVRDAGLLLEVRLTQKDLENEETVQLVESLAKKEGSKFHVQYESVPENEKIVVPNWATSVSLIYSVFEGAELIVGPNVKSLEVGCGIEGAVNLENATSLRKIEAENIYDGRLKPGPSVKKIVIGTNLNIAALDLHNATGLKKFEVGKTINGKGYLVFPPCIESIEFDDVWNSRNAKLDISAALSIPGKSINVSEFVFAAPGSANTGLTAELFEANREKYEARGFVDKPIHAKNKLDDLHLFDEAYVLDALNKAWSNRHDREVFTVTLKAEHLKNNEILKVLTDYYIGKDDNKFILVYGEIDKVVEVPDWADKIHVRYIKKNCKLVVGKKVKYVKIGYFGVSGTLDLKYAKALERVEGNGVINPGGRMTDSSSVKYLTLGSGPSADMDLSGWSSLTHVNLGQIKTGHVEVRGARMHVPGVGTFSKENPGPIWGRPDIVLPPQLEWLRIAPVSQANIIVDKPVNNEAVKFLFHCSESDWGTVELTKDSINEKRTELEQNGIRYPQEVSIFTPEEGAEFAKALKSRWESPYRADDPDCDLRIGRSPLNVKVYSGFELPEEVVAALEDLAKEEGRDTLTYIHTSEIDGEIHPPSWATKVQMLFEIKEKNKLILGPRVREVELTGVLYVDSLDITQARGLKRLEGIEELKGGLFVAPASLKYLGVEAVKHTTYTTIHVGTGEMVDWEPETDRCRVDLSAAFPCVLKSLPYQLELPEGVPVTKKIYKAHADDFESSGYLNGTEVSCKATDDLPRSLQWATSVVLEGLISEDLDLSPYEHIKYLQVGRLEEGATLTVGSSVKEVKFLYACEGHIELSGATSLERVEINDQLHKTGSMNPGPSVKNVTFREDCKGEIDFSRSTGLDKIEILEYFRGEGEYMLPASLQVLDMRRNSTENKRILDITAAVDAGGLKFIGGGSLATADPIFITPEYFEENRKSLEDKGFRYNPSNE